MQLFTFFLYNLNGCNKQVVPGGVAARSGKLRMGDRLIKVNGTELTGATHRDAVQLLLQPGPTLMLTVRHDPLPPGFQVCQTILL